jgi:GNAT superfamily N-acetyltransferase
MVTIVQAASEEHIRQVQALFIEYFEFLRTDVDTSVDDLNDVPVLAGYEDEIATLPGRYAPPDGCLLLALHDSQNAGCVGFYKFDEGVCEVKRLWTRPQFRGQKIGRALMETLIETARQSGYKAIILSTVDILKEARSMYSSFGFEPIAPYLEMPPEMLAHEIFLRLDLSP